LAYSADDALSSPFFAPFFAAAGAGDALAREGLVALAAA
jgi:hypothetical protein